MNERESLFPCRERHERGKIERGQFGWQAVCLCDWRGPWRAHPLDCGADLLDHQLNRKVMAL